MKYFLLAISLLSFSCKESSDKYKPETDLITPEISESTKAKTDIREGALKADFIGNKDSLYAFIKEIDASNKTTLIGFENEKLPEITIPESTGAHLQALKLKNFDKDLLLVNAKLPDTNFNEHYVFLWKDSSWNQPVNRFDIHKSNMSNTLTPIRNDPKDSTKLLRYYSAFEMDRTSDKKFTWKLMLESIPVKK